MVVTLLAVVSLALPDNDSSLGPIWAFAAIARSVAFVGAALREGNTALDIDLEPLSRGETTGGSPRWIKLIAISILAVAAGIVVLHLTGGGGPMRHGQP